jgi:predicted transcriptional regulator|nr:MAG TPA: LexA DNA binding domain [Caudoviricetes sp.]
MGYKRFQRDNHITIQGFMIVDLGLSGNELIMYALIYGFCQNGEAHFHGSLNYITTALNVTRPNAKKILDRLVEKGLLKKREVIHNGVKFCDYKTTFDECCQNDNRGGIVSADGRYSFDNGGSIETIPNNNKDNNKDKTDEQVLSEKRAKFHEMCEPYVDKYGRTMVNAFIDYWTEANGRKLRWEVKRAESGAFEISRRLATWAGKEYNKPSVQKPVFQPKPQTPKRTPWEQMGLTEEQYRTIYK